ncbi:hypothetical protein PIB30_080361 [Stylosanthes scabra]|uniref:Uncharacterized protein n=1 Tax=Stylosanthes scabra TaxID=79078 RepID=A0ABU6QS11_9FABA|nr:hypothetical protein [Stylosanthes scabra]
MGHQVSTLLATLKHNTSSPTSKVSCPGARITRPGVSHPAFRDKPTTATLWRPVPTPRRASHQNPASRTKTRPRSGAMHLHLGVGNFPSPANPAPKPRPGMLHQRPSVGLQTKSRSQSSMTHAQAWSLKYRRESACLAGRKSYSNVISS